MTDEPIPRTRRERRERESQETVPIPRRRTSGEQPTVRLEAQPETARPETGPLETTRLAVAEPAFRQERQVRPVPVALAAGGVVVAVLATLVIVGVAGNHGAEPAPVAVTSTTPTPVVTSAPPSPSAAPVADTPRRAAEPNECVDAVGEGGSVDLDSARLSLEKGDLVARFELASALPEGAASLGIYAESRDGSKAYQLAATWKDGELASFFIHDFQRGRDTKLDPRDIEWDGTSVTAAFPDDINRSLGNAWRWYAFSSADGADVDACPGDPLSFDELTFDENAGN